MTRLVKAILAGALAIMLGACESDGQKEQFGTILGGVAGALLGAQVGSGGGRIAATAAGTLIGAMVGRSIGRSLDKADRVAMASATRESLESAPSGEVTSWRNPDTGHHGTVTPDPAFRNAEGSTCREYRQTVTIGERTEEADGTACRQADGTWKIVNG